MDEDIPITDKDIADRERGTILTDVAQKFTILEIIIMAALIIFFLYLYNTTQPVFNFDNETKTYLYTQATEKVYPKGVTGSEAAFGIGMVLVFLFLSIKDSLDRPLTLRQSEAIARKEMYYWKKQNHPDFQGDIIPGCATVTHFKNKDGQRDVRLNVHGFLVMSKAGPKHFVVSIRPISPRKGYPEDILKRTTPLDESHTCAGCHGKYSDLTYIDSPDVAALKRLKGTIGGRR